MTDDFVITPNPSQQARYRTRCGFPSELRPPGSAAIDLKRRKDAARTSAHADDSASLAAAFARLAGS
jgi:hypothetical protein